MPDDVQPPVPPRSRAGRSTPRATTSVLVLGAALAAGFGVLAVRPTAWQPAVAAVVAGAVLGAAVAAVRATPRRGGARPASAAPAPGAASRAPDHGGAAAAAGWVGAPAAPPAAALVGALRTPAAVLDRPGGRVVAANAGMADRLGRAPEDVAGAPAGVLRFARRSPSPAADDGAHEDADDGSVPAAGGGRLARWCVLRPDGTEAAVEVAVTEVASGGGLLVVAHDGQLADVGAHAAEDRRAHEAELAHQATHDPLTGLPNRVLLMDRLGQALSRAARGPWTVGVIFCDLDRFKVVNDSLGHSAGDQLLVAVAERLRAAIRPGDTVARFSGDEFVVLCEHLDGIGAAEAIAGRLLAALRAPVVVDSGELVVSGSLGIALASGPGATAEEVVRDADAAMYRAKERGRDRSEVFDAALRDRAVDRLQTERALRRALTSGELVLHYQPELDLASDRVTGVEALVRWQDPARGLLLPGRFIDIAEETGLIVPLGEQVLRMACAEAASWPAGPDGVAPPVLWVNLSPRQLVDPGIVDLVRDVGGSLLAEDRLGLEVTESSLVPDDDRVTRALQALSDIGVRVAIDDFGTGFASLAYLWRFPADVLKIDRSFVAGLGVERSATVIVASIVQLARTLDRTTVAEGVETGAQLAQVRRLGCDQVQGWLLGRAVPGDELRRLLLDPPDLAARAAAQSSDAAIEAGWDRP